jgi:hypothetical protein
MIREMGLLCALANVTEEDAMDLFRAGYRSAEVTEIRDSESPVDPMEASQVLSEWHENTGFLRDDGSPAELSLRAGEFQELCRAAAVDSSASEILDLLTRTASIRRDGDRIAATRRDVIVGDGRPASVTRAVRILGHLASTFTHNLTRESGQPGRFERSVASRRLAERQLPALMAYLAAHGESFLEDLDSWMAARESGAVVPTIGVGIYLFVDDLPLDHVAIGSAIVLGENPQ